MEEVVDKSGDVVNDGAQENKKVDEDDVQVPETMPEDAFFIPLGLIRQRPHTHYNASDPEWQSFVEFGKDRERPPAVRSRSASPLYRDQHLMLYQRSWQTLSVTILLVQNSYRERLGYP